MPLIFLLDTNAVSAAMADHPKIKAKISLYPVRIATSAIVRGEIRYGLERLAPGKRRTNLEAKASVVFSALAIEPITQVAADIYGTTRRSLELQGLSLDDNDLWIAATTLSIGATLVTNDQCFCHVQGLVIEDWSK